MAGEDQQFCLRWNNFPNNFASQFDALRHDEAFVDVTLTCEGRRIEAHKLVLSACSPYFKQLFKGNPCKHPIMFLHNVEFRHLKAIVEFMYVGEVNVAQSHLPAFLRTAESLQIRGLADNHAKFTDGRSLSSINLNSPTKRREDSLSHLSDSNNADETDDFSNSIMPNKRMKHSRSIDGLSHNMQAKMERRDFASDLLDASSSMNPFIGLETTVEAVNPSGLTLQGALDAATAAVPSTSHGDVGLHHNSESSASEGEVVKPHSLDPRPCPECGRVYSNISNLRQHIRLIHYPECIACPLCFKPFKNKLYLKRHLISYHELLPPSYMEKRYSNYNSQQNNSVSNTNNSSPVFTYKSQPPDGFIQRHSNNNNNSNSNSNNSSSNSSSEHNHPSLPHPLTHHIPHHSPHPTAHHIPNNVNRDSLMNHISFPHTNHMPVQAVLSSPPQNFYTPNGTNDYSTIQSDNQQQQQSQSGPNGPPPTTDHSQVHNSMQNDNGSNSKQQSFSPQSSGVTTNSGGVSNTQLDDNTNSSDMNANNSK